MDLLENDTNEILSKLKIMPFDYEIEINDDTDKCSSPKLKMQTSLKKRGLN